MTKYAELSAEQQAVCLYGLRFILNDLMMIALAMLIAIVFNCPLAMSCFIAALFSQRFLSGGFHLKTDGGCLTLSLLVCLLFATIVKVQPDAWILPGNVVLWISGSLLLWCYAPADCPNRPFHPGEYGRSKKYSRQAIVLYSLIMLLPFTCTNALLWGYLAAALSTCAGYYLNWRTQK